MTYRQTLMTTTVCLFVGFSTAALSVADDGQRPRERPRSNGLFGLDLDIDEGGIDLQVGPIRLSVGDDVESRPAEMAWLFRRQEIFGTPVYDKAGKELGHVEELVVDVRNGNIRYAAVEYPRLFGKDKLYAVPWKSLTLYRGEAGIHFLVDIPVKKLRGAPGFHRNKWPNVGNRRWAEAVDVYYGVVVKPGDLKTEFGSEVKPLAKVPHLMRSSDVVDTAVINLEGKPLGTIADLIVDFSTRKIRYGILQLDGIGIENKRYPVRFASLDFRPKDKKQDAAFTLRIEHALLGKAPFFENNNWPSIRDARWSNDVDRYYGVNQPIPKPRKQR